MQLFKIFASLLLDASEFKKGMNEAKEGTEDTGKSVLKLGDLIKSNVIGQAIISGIRTTANAFKSMAQAGIEYNAQIEKYTVSLTTLLGNSEERAKRLMETIKRNAAVTPFDVPSLTQGVTSLVAAGVAADDAMDAIMALGDAVAATGGSSYQLGNMAINLQQIKNSGKATAQDLKQFRSAGINITKMIADSTNQTIDQVEKAGVRYEDIINALQIAAGPGGIYENAMRDQSLTFNGILSTLKDNASALMGEMMASTSEGLIANMSFLNEGILEMKERFHTEGVEGMIAAGAEMLASLTNTIADKTPDLLNQGLKTVSSLLKKFTEKTPDFIKWAFDTVMEMTGKISQTTPELINAGINLLLTLFAEFVNKLPDFIMWAGTLVKDVALEIIRNMPYLMQRALFLLQTLINNFLDKLPEFVSWAFNLVKEVGIELVRQAPMLIGQGLLLIANLLAGLVSTLITMGVEIVGNIIKGILSMGVKMMTVAQNFMDENLEKPFKNLISQVGGWGKDFVQGFANGIIGHMQGVLNTVMDLANRIRSFLHFSRPDEGPLRDYETWMPDFMQGLAKGIKDNEYLVTNEMEKLAKDMNISSNITGSIDGAGANGKANNSPITMNIYSKTHTRADLMEEAMYKLREAEMQYV